MTTFLSKELREGLAAARKLAEKRKSRLRIDVDGRTYPVLRVWNGGPAVELPGQALGREIHLPPVAGGDPQDARL